MSLTIEMRKKPPPPPSSSSSGNCAAEVVSRPPPPLLLLLDKEAHSPHIMFSIFIGGLSPIPFLYIGF